MIKIEVSNAQQGGPTSWYSVRVTLPGMRAPAPGPSAPLSDQNPQSITLPAGTSIMVRMIDSVDSSKNKIGDPFHASLDSPLTMGDTVIAPKGADVYGKLTQAKAAGNISGGAELTLEMTGIQIGGSIVPVDTTDYDAVSKGRGKQSAARIGGGAALGSIIGGIARGGKGAAIGAGAGAAAGTAVQLATHGQQIHIPSETLLEFKLQQPVPVPVAGTSVAASEMALPAVDAGSGSPLASSESAGNQASPPAAQTAAHDKAAGYVVTSSDDFGKIDLTTGKYTQVGHMKGLSNHLGGLGTVDGRLYGGAIRTGNLYELNASNGNASLVGSGKLSYFVTGSTTNALFAVGQDMNLYSIDAKTGAAMLIGPTGFNPANVGGGALSSGAKVLYMSAGTNYGAKLYSLNTSTGAAAEIGPIGSDTGAPPMVYESDTLYATLNFPSKRICKLGTTGLPTCFAGISGIPGYAYGLASASSVLTSQAVSSPANQLAAESVPAAAGASVVSAMVREQATSLELPPGKMYLYGMATGGGAPSSEFATGPYAKVLNTAGKLSAALAYGPNGQNSYSTQTAYHDIAGVSVAGSWKDFAAYYGANHKTGAHDASVSFQTKEDSLVVVLALASSQQFASIEGLPNLQVDASGNGSGIVIAHAYAKPGTYNVVENSKVLAAGQDPAHMTDLVGVFVFSGKQESEVSTAAPEQRPAASVGGTSEGNIRSVDFQNFDYTTNCLSENDPAQAIHVSNGQASNQDGQFWAGKPVYGDLKGDGHEQAAVALGCHPADVSPNVNFSEVFVFEFSDGSATVVAKLPPSSWKQALVTGLKVSNRQLAVDFLEVGMGSNACPEWVVTAKLHWNGSGFVNEGESRRKNSCAQQAGVKL